MTVYTAPKTITKTTMKLVPGDVISIGNMFSGFDTYKIVSVTPSQYNPRMAVVKVQFNHGGTCDMVEGKNARWSIITKEATCGSK